MSAEGAKIEYRLVYKSSLYSDDVRLCCVAAIDKERFETCRICHKGFCRYHVMHHRHECPECGYSLMERKKTFVCTNCGLNICK